MIIRKSLFTIPVCGSARCIHKPFIVLHSPDSKSLCIFTVITHKVISISFCCIATCTHMNNTINHIIKNTFLNLLDKYIPINILRVFEMEKIFIRIFIFQDIDYQYLFEAFFIKLPYYCTSDKSTSTCDRYHILTYPFFLHKIIIVSILPYLLTNFRI